MSIHWKILDFIIARRMEKHLDKESKNKISWMQNGFKKGVGTEPNITFINELIKKDLE